MPGSLSGLQTEGHSFFQQSKDAAAAGPASDGVQAIQQGLAINHIGGGGTKRRPSAGEEEAISGLPWATADHARAMIADIFKLRTLRISRVVEQFKLSEALDRDSRLPTRVSHVIFHLLFAGQLHTFFYADPFAQQKSGTRETSNRSHGSFPGFSVRTVSHGRLRGPKPQLRNSAPGSRKHDRGISTGGRATGLLLFVKGLVGLS